VAATAVLGGGAVDGSGEARMLDSPDEGPAGGGVSMPGSAHAPIPEITTMTKPKIVR
jgi:hypothetical protein